MSITKESTQHNALTEALQAANRHNDYERLARDIVKIGVDPKVAASYAVEMKIIPANGTGMFYNMIAAAQALAPVRNTPKLKANRPDLRVVKSEPTHAATSPLPAPSSDEWQRELIYNAEGQLRSTVGNAALILAHDPTWIGRIAFNEFTLRDCLLLEPPWGRAYKARKPFVPGQPWTDRDDTRATQYLAKVHGVRLNPSQIKDALGVAAECNAFHPVRDYFDGLVWDGVPRLSKWLHVYFGATDTEYHSAVGTWWMISAPARIYKPGCQVDHTMILEGKQGKGKSQGLKALASAAWFADDLPDISSKDAKLQLRGKLIVEFSELAALKKSDVTDMKKFLTMQVDNVRAPYDRRDVSTPRQNIFAGTTNDGRYLRDETGNRRFWPVKCDGKIDVSGITRDRDQLWAEAVHRYKAGELWWPTDAKMVDEIESQQEARRAELPWENKIANWLKDRYEVSTDEILMELGKPIGTWTHKDKTDVGVCMHSLGYEPFRKGKQRGFWRLARVT